MLVSVITGDVSADHQFNIKSKHLVSAVNWVSVSFLSQQTVDHIPPRTEPITPQKQRAERCGGAYLPPRPILRRLRPVQRGGRVSSVRQCRRHWGRRSGWSSPLICSVQGWTNKQTKKVEFGWWTWELNRNNILFLFQNKSKTDQWFGFVTVPRHLETASETSTS